MKEERRRRFDPLAFAFIALAIVTAVAVAAYLAYRLRADTAAPPPVAKNEQPPEKAAAEVRDWIESTRPKAPAPQEQKAAQAPAAASDCSTLSSVQPVPAPRAAVWRLGDEGRRWRYRVSVDAPASWADATLEYRMHDSTASQIVQAHFERGETNATFRLGNYAAGHASHAYMRFPGFFMLPVYLDRPLEDGARFSWQTPWPLEHTSNLRRADAAQAVGWMWHLPQLLLEEGRVKRYAARVRKWDEVDTPLGKVAAACIEATVSYAEKGRTLATTRETFWYAPKLAAVVKAIHEGDAPDETARRITAELLEIRPAPFELADARPRKDTVATDLGDGSFVPGDGDFSPDRLSLLRQHLNSVVGTKLAGKRVEVGRLVTYYVRTPKAATVERGSGLPPVPAEQYFDLPKLRSFPYWVVCSLDLVVDGKSLHGRGVVGFAASAPDFASHHRQALIGAANEAIRGL